MRLNADAPAEIYLKLENLQPIGAFKIRGAANAMARLSRDDLERGVLTASAGNMAQGVAWFARQARVPCTVVAPDSAPRTKVAAIERLGGRVILVPFARWWETFESRAFPGVDGTFIHAFDDLDVMAGNGTIGIEILDDLPDVQAIVVPWGGGGLFCGIAAAVRALRPSCRLYADEVAAAVRLLAERNRVIAEGAGACPVACALAAKAGKGRIVCVVSGGNLDLDRFGELVGRRA